MAPSRGLRYLGVDVGAETIKLVELTREPGGTLRWTRRALFEHQKDPTARLRALLADWQWSEVHAAAACGRLSRQLNLARVPTQQAQSRGYRELRGGKAAQDATLVAIGSRGFSVLELRASGTEVFRENSRCSQGTGNFLRQLVERFDLDVEQASALCADVPDPAPLSGRCPVILKTDMTHLANKGESRPRILAGLYDAVCENVQVLIKPRLSPPTVALLGGVSRAERVREHFRRFLARHGMTLALLDGDDGLYVEALGAAALAADAPAAHLVPPLDALLLPTVDHTLERVPGLADYLDQVTRMPAPPPPTLNGAPRRLVLGYDIGSTGSKVVALDCETREAIWQGYVNTSGDPVGACQALTQQLVTSPAGHYSVVGVAATGSGREIVGSLLATCYGPDRVYVLNEIAAHAAGARHYDPRVDTIFEIGGQDAKYIRLADGRVIDAAMNEACSAGTGSFIAEQGRKLAGIRDVVHLGEEAMEADCGVSLGQHCSVFMAEVIDEAAAAGVDQRAIVAGIYDSIIQNYLNRVKGARSVGEVIFCQGMPFAADALATAVARQTGAQVIVPPHPGTVGALGIALLACEQLTLRGQPALELQRLLEAALKGKETFVCKSTQGCGGAGNKCRIDRITTVVAEQRQHFTWGGGCSLYDRGTGKRKLPDLAPDPFRERAENVQTLIDRLGERRGRPLIALTDEFALKGLMPFFATFLRELNYDVKIHTGADQRVLKRGIEQANVPFCAPMQLYHGLIAELRESGPDYLFVPMLRSLERVGEESCATVCPIVQASPDLLRWDLGSAGGPKVLSPVIDIGPDNLASNELIESCRRLAVELGVVMSWWPAYQAALAAQTAFDAECLALGRRALDFCARNEIVPVVVLGRAYTLHNRVLNSNVPAIVREQGAIAIPVDCYPIDTEVPVYKDMFWGYGQRILRAAHQLRRKPGEYSIFCSNYSCGPDSFNLHFFAYLMEGKPFAIIETDGHSGDAGTKTRVEAFLYCVHEDLRSSELATTAAARDLTTIEEKKAQLPDIRAAKERVLIPRMGEGAEVLAAALRGVGVPAEALPVPDRDTVRLGRRHTSGKECLPMALTLGSLLQRLGRDEDESRFAFFMPTATGPCRFGVYNILHKITLERLGYEGRVRVWSPSDNDYFAGIPVGFSALVFSGFMAADLLLEALYDVRPGETRPGAARAIFDAYRAELWRLLERRAAGNLSLPATLAEVATGEHFGCTELLARAAREFAAIKGGTEKPAVLVVGEIYVRCDPFANDYVVDQLERRGLRCRFAPFNEWLEYTDFLTLTAQGGAGLTDRLRGLIKAQIQQRSYDTMAAPLDWPARTTVQESLEAAADYLRPELHGESVLTVGGPTHEWREGLIDGVISVGPLECMPNKISQAQFFHVTEREGLPALTLALNGDPVDPEQLDSFAFEVLTRYRERHATPQVLLGAAEPRLAAELGSLPPEASAAAPAPQTAAPCEA
ncbi:MAG: CoA activase [Proteobacteria bacterium]|nr:CoA activase [Pseudomonadota bacterium]